MTSAYESHLDRNEANYTPLTPLSLIARAAFVYPNQLSVVHADRHYTWALAVDPNDPDCWFISAMP